MLALPVAESRRWCSLAATRQRGRATRAPAKKGKRKEGEEKEEKAKREKKTAPSGFRKAKGEQEDGAHQPPNLDSVPADPSPSDQYFKISK